MTTLAGTRRDQDEDRDPLAVDVPEQAPAGPSTDRVASVDALRGLTILLMIFVNDLGRAAPSWLHHIQPPRADGMTVADVVFPSFLFIVGVSIPLAFERARRLGRSRGAEVRHILGRTAALLVMGLVQLNSDDDRTLGGRTWGLLAFTSLVLAWSAVPRKPGRRRQVFIGLKSLGVVGLLALLVVYRREPVATDVLFYGHVERWVWLRTEWWGILGLIAWAYLTVSVLTLWLGDRREWLTGAMALLMVMHLASARGGFFGRLKDKPWLGEGRRVFDALAAGVGGVEQYVGLGSATGSLAAVTMAGCLLGSVLRRDSLVGSHRDRLKWAATLILGLVVAGAMTDTFEGINKIGATPTWCFWSAAIAAAVWLVLYLVMDVRGFRAWSVVVRPAGANPLVAYFLHPITVWLVGLAGLGPAVLGYKGSPDAWAVMGGSAGMALFVCAATALFSRLGLRVRL